MPIADYIKAGNIWVLRPSCRRRLSRRFQSQGAGQPVRLGVFQRLDVVVNLHRDDAGLARNVTADNQHDAEFADGMGKAEDGPGDEAGGCERHGNRPEGIPGAGTQSGCNLPVLCSTLLFGILVRIKPPFIRRPLHVFAKLHALLGNVPLDQRYLAVLVFVYASLPLSIADERIVSERAFWQQENCRRFTTTGRHSLRRVIQ